MPASMLKALPIAGMVTEEALIMEYHNKVLSTHKSVRASLCAPSKPVLYRLSMHPSPKSADYLLHLQHSTYTLQNFHYW